MKFGRCKVWLFLGLIFAGTVSSHAYAQTAPKSPVLAVAGNNTRFIVEQTTSLAWWQMNPNYGHLWATTCPGDPNWQAGEGHTNGYEIEKATKKKTRVSAYLDYRIPLYPRLEVKPVCRKCVVGNIALKTAGDLTSAHGIVEIMVDSLENGSAIRNKFAKHSVLQTETYPRITFTLDSIGNVEMVGDTVTGVAKGSWVMHGVTKPLFFPVTMYKEGDAIRVKGKAATFPRVLLEEYKMSKVALGAGVGMNLWKELHFGFDLIFKPAVSASSP